MLIENRKCYHSITHTVLLRLNAPLLLNALSNKRPLPKGGVYSKHSVISLEKTWLYPV